MCSLLVLFNCSHSSCQACAVVDLNPKGVIMNFRVYNPMYKSLFTRFSDTFISVMPISSLSLFLLFFVLLDANLWVNVHNFVRDEMLLSIANFLSFRTRRCPWFSFKGAVYTKKDLL